jgi:hypothetical protein
VRPLDGGAEVVSAFSIKVLDCVQPVLKKNGLFVLGNMDEVADCDRIRKVILRSQFVTSR